MRFRFKYPAAVQSLRPTHSFEGDNLWGPQIVGQQWWQARTQREELLEDGSYCCSGCAEKNSPGSFLYLFLEVIIQLSCITEKGPQITGGNRVSVVGHQALTLLELICSYCTFPCWNYNFGQVVNIVILTGNPLTLWKSFILVIRDSDTYLSSAQNDRHHI